MDEQCIFCRIIAGKSPARFFFRDDLVVAFQDIRPVAPHHILIVPKKHIPSVNHLRPEDTMLMGHLFGIARKLAEEQGIAESGYRLIVNTGPDAGQAVYHIHMHLIGGQRMRFPMG